MNGGVMTQVELEELFHLYISFYSLTGNEEYKAHAERIKKLMEAI